MAVVGAAEVPVPVLVPVPVVLAPVLAAAVKNKGKTFAPGVNHARSEVRIYDKFKHLYQ